MIKFFEKIKKYRIDFIPIKKKQIIIYGWRDLSLLEQHYFKDYSFYVISLVEKTINFFLIIHLITGFYKPECKKVLKKLFSGNFKFKDYILFLLEVTKPKLFFTFLDNYQEFWEISHYAKCKSMIFQNGWRSIKNDVWENLEPRTNKFKVDYILTWTDAIKKIYKNQISGNFITAGSFKNNHYNITNPVKNNMLFISQFRDFELWKKIKYFQKNVFGYIENLPEDRLFPLLKKYLEKKNNISLSIMLTKPRFKNNERSYSEEMEIEYYKEKFKNIPLDFIFNKGDGEAYEAIDRSQLVIFIDSSLGYEALARKSKTICLPKRLDSIDSNFGWPYYFEKKGPFWSNDLFPSFEELSKLIDDNLNKDSEIWIKEFEKELKNLCYYDPNNSLFRNTIKEIIINN